MFGIPLCRGVPITGVGHSIKHGPEMIFRYKGFPRARYAGNGHASPDMHYPFVRSHGAGVYEIPVGPIHGALWSRTFWFQAISELILNLEERLGMCMKASRKCRRQAAGSWARWLDRFRVTLPWAIARAACRAMEQAAGVEIPPARL